MRAERRRRGRAIRRARRLAAEGVLEVVLVPDTASFARRLAGVSVAVRSATALVRAIEASTFTARVALERLGLAYLSPHPGARRQLLEHGRAPRKGRR